MGYGKSFRAAYSEEMMQELCNGPDGPHGGVKAMRKAISEGRDSFTYNGRTYFRGRLPEAETAFARFIRKLFGGT